MRNLTRIQARNQSLYAINVAFVAWTNQPKAYTKTVFIRRNCRDQQNSSDNGVTGQDGAYLARFLLKKGYTVHGMKRRASSFNTQRIDDIYSDPHDENVNFFLHYGDLTDSSNIMRLVQTIEPMKFTIWPHKAMCKSVLKRQNIPLMPMHLALCAFWKPYEP